MANPFQEVSKGESKCDCRNVTRSIARCVDDVDEDGVRQVKYCGEVSNAESI